MAKRKFTKKQKEVLYKRLYSVILRYGSAKIILENNNHFNKEEYGQRFIKKSGKCNVSYTGDNYKKKYQLSCFYEDYIGGMCKCCKKKKITLIQTLREMYKHDGNWLDIKSVSYGPRFKKKMKLK